ncbi:MAG TPA: undecaprenyl-diphosphate phosphatase, partial [Candidatus Gracilibacteria bacterium]|nr:undecaprenyl-diphosphate phosphatase [Candidatus Gracilibacteria bacterium]
FNDFLEENFRNTTSVATMLIVIAIYFVVAEIVKRKRTVQKIGLFQAVLIGCAQAVALIPGVSRSGITISTGLVQGVRRDEAARFSFLLGSVAITAATALSIFKVMKGEFLMPSLPILLTGIASSFLAGYVSISLLMKFLKSHPLHVFAIYRILLAVVILSFF